METENRKPIFILVLLWFFSPPSISSLSLSRARSPDDHLALARRSSLSRPTVIFSSLPIAYHTGPSPSRSRHSLSPELPDSTDRSSVVAAGLPSEKVFGLFAMKREEIAGPSPQASWCRPFSLFLSAHCSLRKSQGSVSCFLFFFRFYAFVIMK
eukprot:TRINITY_DN5223_c0_g2_i4.p1 TRINITY_DN5223_c0_g2~~TRINITY_DN5223_c0_g2_i4.p1  ORF type:complete len:154 (+),score=14.38 TRINITY_DN5223_c0_g2_i4:672-1133(+)